MFLFAQKQKLTRQAILTLIGAILIKLSTGIISTFGNTGIYYLSYLKMNGQTINKSSNALVLLVSIIPMTIITLAATKLSNKFGYINIIKLCAFTYLLSPLMFTILPANLYVLAIFNILIPGTAFGISAIPLLNIVWVHFPKNKHSVTSIIIFFFTLSSMIWNYVTLMLINPHNIQANIQFQGQFYFDHNITDNVIKATRIIFGVAGTCFIVGSYLLTQKKQQQAIQLQLSEMIPGTTIENLQQLEKPSLRKLIFSQDFICIYASSFILSFYFTYISTNFKIIFLTVINDDHFLTYLSITYSVAGMVGTFFWGHIADKNGVRNTILYVTILDCIIKLFIIVVNNKFTFSIYYVTLGFMDKAMVTIVAPGLVEIFGLKGGTELLPIKATSVILTFGLLPVAQLLTLDYLAPIKLLQMLSLFNLISLIPGIILNRKIN